MGNKNCSSCSPIEEEEATIVTDLANSTPKKNVQCESDTPERSDSESLALTSGDSTVPPQAEEMMLDGVYRVIKKLGSGISGDVLMVEDIHDSKKYALKRLDRQDKWSDALFASETAFLRSLGDQKNIIKLVRTFADSKYYYVMTELGACDLFSQVKDGHQMDEKLAKKIIRQLLEQLEVLHERNIAHRDIKPENVVFMDGELNEVKLIDFADAKKLEDEMECRELVGTPCYLSPERWDVHQGWELKAADVWAIGVLTFEMVTGKRCFNGKTFDEMREFVQDEKWDFPKDAKISNLCAHFIECLLTADSDKRPTAKLSLRHPWLCDQTNVPPSESVYILKKLVDEWNYFTNEAVPEWACYVPIIAKTNCC